MSAEDAACKTWDDACKRVGNEMAAHTQPFVASISREVGADAGEHVGTGTYVELRGKPYLMTNEHVARFRLRGSLGHLLKRDEYAFRIIHPFQCLSWPTDAAITRIDEEQFSQSDRRAVSPDRIAPRYLTAHHELLFILGFPAVRSRMSLHLGGLVTGGVPYVSQEMPLPQDCDPRIFFAVQYPWDRPLLRCDGTRGCLPDPHGMSGSVVWDTQFVAKQGERWYPEDARIVGLIRGWKQAEHALIGVRIEVVREFLVLALQKEAAYFRWLGRGKPEGQDWEDWFWVVDEIGDIA